MASIPVLGVWPTTRQVLGVVGGLVFLSLLMLDGHFRGYSLGLLTLAISVPLSYGLANAADHASDHGRGHAAFFCGVVDPDQELRG